MATTHPTSYPTGSQPTGYPSGSHPSGYPKPGSGYTPNMVERVCMSFSEAKPTEHVHGIKVRYLMNFYKATTALLIFTLMKNYGNFSLGSFLYLALHGIYGIVWLLKDVVFPDKNLDRRMGVVGAITHFIVLSAYWVLPWLQISGHGIDHPSSERVLTTIAMFTLGLALMLVSDAQKNFTLKHNQGLITDGMFKYTRNPNILGEMLIQSSFAFATGSIVGWGIIFTFWTLFFIPRMIAKDISLRNKEGSSEYFSRSSMLLPKLFFRNTFLHYLTWAIIFGGILWLGEVISMTHFFKKIIHPNKTLFGKWKW